MSDAFDSDVLIRAAKPAPEGDIDRAILERSLDRIGSVVLLPETTIKSFRWDQSSELANLTELLAGIDLKPVDEDIADASVTLGAKYGLRAPDAIHLATAVVWGAERFYTHNTKDFGPHITEIDVVVPGGD